MKSKTRNLEKMHQKAPETDFQKWLVDLFDKLHSLTENNHIPKSNFIEYGFQKIGKNFSYPVSEKFTTSKNLTKTCEEEIAPAV